MKWENLTEAQIAWILWNLYDRLTDLLWDRYENEFLDFAMDDNERKHMDQIEEEMYRFLEPEF